MSHGGRAPLLDEVLATLAVEGQGLGVDEEPACESAVFVIQPRLDRYRPFPAWTVTCTPRYSSEYSFDR